MITFEDIKDYLIPAIVGLITWFGKDKLLHTLNIKREVKNQESISLDNLQKKLDIYQEMLTDVPEKYKAQIAELEASFQASMTRLENEIDNLKKINSDLEELVREQRALIAKQNSSLVYYERKYGAISKN